MGQGRCTAATGEKWQERDSKGLPSSIKPPEKKDHRHCSNSGSYLHTVVERVRERFPAEDVDKMEQMLTIISEELMPELDLRSKTADE